MSRYSTETPQGTMFVTDKLSVASMRATVLDLDHSNLKTTFYAIHQFYENTLH